MGEYHRKGFGLKDTVKPMLHAAYASGVVDLLRSKGYQLTRGNLTVRLAKEFGFCFGVERAVDIAYQTRQRFPDKRIFITNEIIHNASVNQRLREMGFIFLSGHDKAASYDEIQSSDVVVLPAFGVSIKELESLRAKNCTLVDTTCGAVVKVWVSVERFAKDGFTCIVHGKYNHEETVATCSRAGARYLVIRDIGEADYVAGYVLEKGNRAEFLQKFAKALSPGFDPDKDLQRLGIANQTTMLSTESREIAERLRAAFLKKYGATETAQRFRSLETVCNATQDRQDAVKELLSSPPDVMLIIGGYNSSNTTHLAELALQRCPAYHIDDAECMISRNQIRHLKLGAKTETIGENWWPEKAPLAIGVTAGASTPNNKIGDLILRLFELAGEDISSLVSGF
ncbi:MAG TPA: 4-hydroxy-3-methylbut-2-enyl diphosphate reductase [Planctomycetota bacterium]|jgi:4-hydroxy-3-methylbut-2-enyl diphosphate reductase